jgi:hypothetical protein
MVTEEEIDRRIQDKDAPRSARRAAAAKRIAELAQRHAVLIAQVNDIERALGEALAESHDVIDVNELHEFTDVPTVELNRWLTTHTTVKNTRAKRKRATATAPSTDRERNQQPSEARKPPEGTRAAPGARPGPGAPHTRVPVEVA